MKSHRPYIVGEFTVFRLDGSVRQVVRRTFQNESDDTLALRVRDRSGIIIREKIIPVRSFVKNFAVMMCTRFGNWNRNYIDTSGVSRSIGSAYSLIDAAAGNTTKGMWVGTDDGTILPLAPSNYDLGAKIAHGSGSGQLDYKLQLRVAVAASGNDYDMQYHRDFENLSGGTIVIKETCLVMNSGYNFMVCRDIEDLSDVAFNLSVLNGQTAESRYTLKITQNSGFVKNYLLALDSSFWNSARIMTDTNGDPLGENFGGYPYTYELNAAAGTDSYGLQLGSNSTALSCDDYALGSKIAHGTGAGQLSYAIGMVEAEYVDGNDSIVKVTRTFTNDSGSSVIIRESGIVIKGRNGQVMIGRLLSGTIELQASESIQTKMTFIHPV